MVTAATMLRMTITTTKLTTVIMMGMAMAIIKMVGTMMIITKTAIMVSFFLLKSRE